jgi:hypothetical protein
VNQLSTATLRGMLDRLTAADFAPLLGERFELEAPGADPFEITLTSCDESPGGAGGGRVPFSLIFHADVLVPQQICSIRHPKLGDLDVFVVPIEPDARGMRYEVTFN